MLAYTCNPSSQVTEAGESWVQGQLGLYNTPLSQTQKKKQLSNSSLYGPSLLLCPLHKQTVRQPGFKSEVPFPAHSPAQLKWENLGCLRAVLSFLLCANVQVADFLPVL